MGVVHKFKEDVIEFILAQKRDNPQFSCRKLSQIVSEKFQTSVSKSAVSTVLKEANLSSPVGRHGGMDEEEENVFLKPVSGYKIPQEKKKNIFPESFKEQLPIKENLALPVKKIEEKKPDFIAERIIQQEPKEMSSLRVDIPSPENLDKFPLSQIGLIWLEAAQWDIAGGSLLAKIFHEEFPHFNFRDCELAAQICLYAPWLGLNNFMNLHNQISDDVLHFWGYKKSDVSDSVLLMVSAASTIPQLGIKLSAELSVASPRIAKMKFAFEDAQDFFINLKTAQASFTNVQSEFSYPLNIALEKCRQYIGKNVQSEMMFIVGENENTSIFGKIDEYFASDTTHNIRQVSLLDQDDLELSRFPITWQKKDGYCILLQSRTKIWQDWQSLGAIASHNSRGELLSVFNQQFMFFDCTQELSRLGIGVKAPFQAVFAKEVSQTQSEAILIFKNSNLKDTFKKAVSQYLRFCLFQIESAGYDKGKNILFSTGALSDKVAFQDKFLESLSISPSFEEALNRLRDVLWRWCQDAFFGALTKNSDDKSLKAVLTQARGHWQKSNEYFIFTLKPSVDLFSLDDWQKVLEAFNNHKICDSQGRRLLMLLASDE